MNPLIASTALHPASKASVVPGALRGPSASVFDLSSVSLPLCDDASCFQPFTVQATTPQVRAATPS